MDIEEIKDITTKAFTTYIRSIVTEWRDDSSIIKDLRLVLDSLKFIESRLGFEEDEPVVTLKKNN